MRTLLHCLRARESPPGRGKPDGDRCVERLEMVGYLTKLPTMTGVKARARCKARAHVIKALAHPSRIVIAEALSEGERCVCELTELVGADISTVSKHLSVMKASGLVEVEKRGLNQFYRLRCPCLPEFFRCVDLIAQSPAGLRRKAAA
jgi:DNA-binding transcriptional ArsR family regulator